MAVEHHEVFIEQRSADAFEGMRISWGGVFGGVLAGIGLLMLLSSLGIAVGISAVDPRNPDGSAIGTGAAIWTALTLLIALFVGGWASTRLSMLWERTTALFEGALVWVLSMILILYLAANGVGLIASGAFGMVGQTMQAAGGSGVLQDLSSGDVDQILGRLQDPQTAQTVASALGLPQQDVESRFREISSRVEAARNDPARAASEMRSGLADLASQAGRNLAAGAAQVQPEATTTAWVAFIALLLSLAAAIAGAAVGRRNVARRVAGDVRA
jgi:hypothetical protein